MVLFTRAIKTKTTLKITPLFKRAKIPPNILLISPRAAKFAIFVKTLSKKNELLRKPLQLKLLKKLSQQKTLL